MHHWDSWEAILSVQRYIALNRWNSEERTLPQDYRFCGYSHYAGLERDDRIDTSEAWLALGETDAERCAVYREMVEAHRQEQGKPSQEQDDLPSFSRAVVEQFVQAVSDSREHDDLPSFYSGTPDYCRTQTERLLQAFREHNRALAAARALSHAIPDGPASCGPHGGRPPYRHTDTSKKD